MKTVVSKKLVLTEYAKTHAAFLEPVEGMLIVDLLITNQNVLALLISVEIQMLFVNKNEKYQSVKLIENAVWDTFVKITDVLVAVDMIIIAHDIWLVSIDSVKIHACFITVVEKMLSAMLTTIDLSAPVLVTSVVMHTLNVDMRMLMNVLMT